MTWTHHLGVVMGWFRGRLLIDVELFVAEQRF